MIHVKEVLNELAKIGLRLKPEKCIFHAEEVPFLGILVGKNGIKIDPDKVKAIAEWPPPRCVKDVQSFLGFVNFNRKFIKGYSSEALPLTTLTQQCKNFEWKEEQQKAFEEIKKLCMATPPLKTWESDLPAVMETDASDLALGACLL